MRSHELAKLLLSLPDLPLATHAMNHTYVTAAHERSHGSLKVGILESYAGQHIVIGDISRRLTNYPNDWVSDLVYGEAPNGWGESGYSEHPKPYAGKTRCFDDYYTRERENGPVRRRTKRIRLRKDGFDRYNTRIGGSEYGCLWWAQVDARGEPAGKWAGRAYDTSGKPEPRVETTRSYDTPEAAMDALNALLLVHDVQVFRCEPF